MIAERWLGLLEDPALVATVAGRTGAPASLVAGHLASIASEARLALRLLDHGPAGPLAPGMRVLEVGAGTGVVGSILRARGVDVTALEPIIAGFELFAEVRAELAARAPTPLIALDRRPAAALDPERDGRFDRIFSVNVLEHCHPLDATLDRMAAVLAPGGAMLHTCPNYRVPYEPHYRMPLMPVVPRMTHLVRPGLAGEPLWQSLNFITAGDLKRAARRNRLRIRFAPGILGDVVARLTADPDFARRQGWAGRVALTLARLGVLAPLARLPAEWQTPMVVAFERPARGD